VDAQRYHRCTQDDTGQRFNAYAESERTRRNDASEDDHPER